LHKVLHNILYFSAALGRFFGQHHKRAFPIRAQLIIPMSHQDDQLIDLIVCDLFNLLYKPLGKTVGILFYISPIQKITTKAVMVTRVSMVMP
jgi:hypothetical protein